MITKNGETMNYILDTYAWVEYFIGSKKGEIVQKLFENDENEFLTVECSLSELKSWCKREKKDFQILYNAIKSNSHLEAVYLEDWLFASDIKSEMRQTRLDFGLIDALLLAKQKKYKCIVVSGDPHFENLTGALYLK